MTKETANVKMRRKDFPNYFPAQARKKPEQMPRRMAVALRESAAYFTRKAVSAVCPAIRSSTVTCQWPGASFRAIGSDSSNAPSLSA